MELRSTGGEAKMPVESEGKHVEPRARVPSLVSLQMASSMFVFVRQSINESGLVGIQRVAKTLITGMCVALDSEQQTDGVDQRRHSRLNCSAAAASWPPLK